MYQQPGFNPYAVGPQQTGYPPAQVPLPQPYSSSYPYHQQQFPYQSAPTYYTAQPPQMVMGTMDGVVRDFEAKTADEPRHDSVAPQVAANVLVGAAAVGYLAAGSWSANNNGVQFAGPDAGVYQASAGVQSGGGNLQTFSSERVGPQGASVTEVRTSSIGEDGAKQSQTNTTDCCGCFKAEGTSSSECCSDKGCCVVSDQVKYECCGAECSFGCGCHNCCPTINCCGAGCDCFTGCLEPLGQCAQSSVCHCCSFIGNDVCKPLCSTLGDCCKPVIENIGAVLGCLCEALGKVCDALPN